MNNIFRKITSILVLAAAAASTAAAGNILSVRDTITDPNIVYPHSFEADTHRMMQNWYMQNYVMLANTDQDTGAPVEATDEEITARLMSMPTVIEMPFNSIVRSYIKMYVDRKRQLVESLLGMSTYYMPIFEQALECEGIPLELKYLPVIESALDPNAVSPAGATGLWQFMMATARGLGMEINSLVDERRDPHRASQMAARYLKQLYDIYGDWSLAIAAYNCGPGNVNKALRRAGEGGKKDFWEIYPYLPAETRGYVPLFIAANYAMNYYDKHNISPALARRPIVTDSVLVNKRVYFQQIADVLGIPVDEIRTLNPQYRQDVIPGDIKAYPLVLPSHQALSYIISEDSIVAHEAEKYARRSIVEPASGSSRLSDDGNYIITQEIKFHKVKKGDTFAKLAKRYGVTASSIKKANGIKTLRRGRTIKIVVTKKTPKPRDPEVTEEVNGQPNSIEVIPADNPDTEAVVTTESELSEEFTEESSDASDNVEAEDNDENGNEEEDDTTVIVEDEVNVEDNNSATPQKNVATTTPAPLTSDADNTKAQDVRHHIESTFNSRKNVVDEPAATTAVKDSKPASADKKNNTVKSDKKKNNAEKPVYHKVKKGETLSKIAKRYGTTVKKIQSLNGRMKGTQVNIGQKIRVK